MPKTIYEPFDWYADPLYYDIIFDSDTPKEATFLDAVHAKWARPTGGGGAQATRRALEPACGTGRLMVALGQMGWDVSGFDPEPAMQRFTRDRLRQEGLAGDVRSGWFHDFDLGAPKFDLAYCLVSSFRLETDPARAQGHLKQIAKHLRVGGVYALGVHMTEYHDDRMGDERWKAKRDGVHVDCRIESWPPDRKARIEKVRTRITAKHDPSNPGDPRAGETRRVETHFAFRTYSLTQLRELLRTEPRLKHVATYTFDHDINMRTQLAGDDLGVVLVLRRV